MKKMLAILLAILMVLSLVACGTDANDENASSNMVEEFNHQELTVRADEEDSSEATLPTQEESTEELVCKDNTRKFYYNQLTNLEKTIYSRIAERKMQFISNTPVMIASKSEYSAWTEQEEDPYLITERALQAYKLDNPISSIWLSGTSAQFWERHEMDENGKFITYDEGIYVAPAGYGYIEGDFTYVELSHPYTVQVMEELAALMVEPPKDVGSYDALATANVRFQRVEEEAGNYIEMLRGDDRQKIVKINQWLFDGCTYREEGTGHGGIYNTIVNHESCCGLCDSLAVKYLADRAGLDVIVVDGLYANENQDTEEEKVKRLHSWNLVFTADEGWSFCDFNLSRDRRMVKTDEIVDSYDPDGNYLGTGYKFETVGVPNNDWLFVNPADEALDGVYFIDYEMGFENP